MLIIEAENENLILGKPVEALVLDFHTEHIKEHTNLLTEPRYMNDPEIVKRVIDHIDKHMNLLRETDIDLTRFIESIYEGI